MSSGEHAQVPSPQLLNQNIPGPFASVFLHPSLLTLICSYTLSPAIDCLCSEISLLRFSSTTPTLRLSTSLSSAVVYQLLIVHRKIVLNSELVLLDLFRRRLARYRFPPSIVLQFSFRNFIDECLSYTPFHSETSLFIAFRVLQDALDVPVLQTKSRIVWAELDALGWSVSQVKHLHKSAKVRKLKIGSITEKNNPETMHEMFMKLPELEEAEILCLHDESNPIWSLNVGKVKKMKMHVRRDPVKRRFRLDLHKYLENAKELQELEIFIDGFSGVNLDFGAGYWPRLYSVMCIFKTPSKISSLQVLGASYCLKKLLVSSDRRVKTEKLSRISQFLISLPERVTSRQPSTCGNSGPLRRVQQPSSG